MFKNFIIGILILLCLAAGIGWWLESLKECPDVPIIAKGKTEVYTPKPDEVVSSKKENLPKKSKIRKVIDKARGLENWHTVKKGETVYGLATRIYGISVPSILAFNNLKNANIEAGQRLYIGTPAQRDSIREQMSRDSLYKYNVPFGDSTTIKGNAYIESRDSIEYIDISWELLGKYQPKNTIGFGGSWGSDRNINGLVMYRTKKGLNIIGEVGLTEEEYRIGIVKEFNLKK